MSKATGMLSMIQTHITTDDQSGPIKYPSSESSYNDSQSRIYLEESTKDEAAKLRTDGATSSKDQVVSMILDIPDESKNLKSEVSKEYETSSKSEKDFNAKSKDFLNKNFDTSNMNPDEYENFLLEISHSAITKLFNRLRESFEVDISDINDEYIKSFIGSSQQHLQDLRSMSFMYCMSDTLEYISSKSMIEKYTLNSQKVDYVLRAFDKSSIESSIRNVLITSIENALFYQRQGIIDLSEIKKRSFGSLNLPCILFEPRMQFFGQENWVEKFIKEYYLARYRLCDKPMPEIFIYNSLKQKNIRPRLIGLKDKNMLNLIEKFKLFPELFKTMVSYIQENTIDDKAYSAYMFKPKDAQGYYIPYELKQSQIGTYSFPTTNTTALDVMMVSFINMFKLANKSKQNEQFQMQYPPYYVEQAKYVINEIILELSSNIEYTNKMEKSASSYIPYQSFMIEVLQLQSQQIPFSGESLPILELTKLMNDAFIKLFPMDAHSSETEFIQILFMFSQSMLVH